MTDRRATNRRGRLHAALALILLFAIGLGAGRYLGPQGPAEDLFAGDVFETRNTPEPFAEAVCDTLRRGDTLTSILLRNRVEVQRIGQVLERVRSEQLFSPKALRPGQSLTVVRDEFGSLQRLRFDLSPEDIFVFETHGDSLVASRAEVDREVRLRKFEGQVTSSFDEAIRRAGGDYRLTLKVADVLAYDVDFLTEVHDGDYFSLLVEERFVNDQLIGYGDVVHAVYHGERANCEALAYHWNNGSNGGHYTPDGQALRKAFLKSPLNFRRISSFFGRRLHPIMNKVRHHSGVDYAADAGTPVVALGDGIVSYCGWKGGYGKTVQIRHDRSVETLYGHFRGFAKGLRAGQQVTQGEVIGYVGQTGNATGPHLHFEVVKNGEQIDPLSFENQPANPIDPDQMDDFARFASRLRDLNENMVAGQVVDEAVLDVVEPALANAMPLDSDLGLR